MHIHYALLNAEWFIALSGEEQRTAPYYVFSNSTRFIFITSTFQFPGKQLEGKLYHPLFPYFAHMRQERNAFRVLANSFVTTDQGTGVVHQAPYFGEVFSNIYYFIM